MSTQVFDLSNNLVMQRNATTDGPLVTVFSSCDEFFNCGQDSVEQRLVVVEGQDKPVRAFEALNWLTRGMQSPVTFTPTQF